jgi:poly(3-hydroxybutyrate) depolymerase
MLYELHHLTRQALRPWAFVSRASARILRHTPLPGAPFAAAGWELIHRLTKEYPRPSFDIGPLELEGEPLEVHEEVVAATPFCRLLRFTRTPSTPAQAELLARQPKVLLCAPLSGHFATLLRETIRTLAPHHDVHVTEWIDAKEIPVSAGRFGLDDYVEHLVAFIRELGPTSLSVIAVCQPAVPALAAVSLMASRNEPLPRSLVLLGGPIDGRRSPTDVNRFAERHPIGWFAEQLCHPVPRGHAGVGRIVYPGFLQLSAFVSMSPRRHLRSHVEYWMARVSGERASAARHEKFYDEYLAVLDMDADYYLETVRVVFQEHALPRGTWKVRGEAVRPGDIRNVALFTIEGGDDDITGAGQCHAALELCRAVPDEKKRALTVPGCGHYGVFSGSQFRDVIAPQIRAFVAEHAEGSC